MKVCKQKIVKKGPYQTNNKLFQLMNMKSNLKNRK